MGLVVLDAYRERKTLMEHFQNPRSRMPDSIMPSFRFAEADFRAASKLSRRVQLLLDAIIADIAYRREAHHVRIEESRGRAKRRA